MHDLIEAVAKASPYLAKGDDARFLSEVARLTQTEPEPKAKPATSAESLPCHPGPRSKSRPKLPISHTRQAKELANGSQPWLRT